MKTKYKSKLTAILFGLVTISLSGISEEIVGDGDSATVSAGHLVPGSPDGSCCQGEGSWVKAGDPSYSWSGNVSGSGATVDWDTSLADPKTKQTKTATVTVSQNWACSISADPSTQTTTKDDNFSIEVWPKCGSEIFDSDTYCCDENRGLKIAKAPGLPCTPSVLNDGPGYLINIPIDRNNFKQREDPCGEMKYVEIGGALVFLGRFTTDIYNTTGNNLTTMSERYIEETEDVMDCGFGFNEKHIGIRDAYSISPSFSVSAFGIVSLGVSGSYQQDVVNLTVPKIEKEGDFRRLYVQIYRREVMPVSGSFTGVTTVDYGCNPPQSNPLPVQHSNEHNEYDAPWEAMNMERTYCAIDCCPSSSS